MPSKIELQKEIDQLREQIRLLPAPGQTASDKITCAVPIRNIESSFFEGKNYYDVAHDQYSRWQKRC